MQVIEYKEVIPSSMLTNPETTSIIFSNAVFDWENGQWVRRAGTVTDDDLQTYPVVINHIHIGDPIICMTDLKTPGKKNLKGIHGTVIRMDDSGVDVWVSFQGFTGDWHVKTWEIICFKTSKILWP